MFIMYTMFLFPGDYVLLKTVNICRLYLFSVTLHLFLFPSSRMFKVEFDKSLQGGEESLLFYSYFYFKFIGITNQNTFTMKYLLVMLTV